MNSKKILSIEQCWKYDKSSNLLMEIPRVDIYDSENVLFYLLDDKKEFLGHKFKELLTSNNNIVNYFEYDQKNNNVKHYYTKEDLKGVYGFLDLNELEFLENSIPLVAKYYELTESYNKKHVNHNKKIQILFQYNNIIKKTSIHYLEKYLEPLKNYYKNYDNLIKNIATKTSNLIAKKEINKIDGELEVFKKQSLDTLLEIINLLIYIFKYFFNGYRNLEEFLNANKEYFANENIQRLQKELFYLKRIQKVSKSKVKNELAIRDLMLENEFLQKSLKNSRNSSKTWLKSLVNWYRKSAEFDYKKAHLFKNDNKIYSHLINKHLIKQRCSYLINKQINKILFLNYDNFEYLKKNINYQIKLFIENNLSSSEVKSIFSKSKVKKIINNEFNFSFESLKDVSKENRENIKETIKINNSKIRQLKKVKNSINSSNNYNEKISILTEKIDNLQNKQHWQDTKDFNNQIGFKQKEAKINIIFQQINNIKNSISKNIAKFSNIDYYTKLIKNIDNQCKKVLEEKVETFKSVNSIFDQFNFFYSTLQTFKKIVFNYKSADEDDFAEVEILDRLLKIVELSSLNFSNIVLPYNELDKLEQIKINIISAVLSGAKVIFVNDYQTNDSKLKEEFLKSLNELTKEFNITYVYVSNDQKLLQNNVFSQIYTFLNNKEIEFGDIHKVTENSINPFFKNPDIDLSNKIFDNKNYVIREFNEISENHYIFAPYVIFKEWINQTESQNQNILIKTAEHILSQEIKHPKNKLVSPLANTDFVFVDLNKFEKEMIIENINQHEHNLSEYITTLDITNLNDDSY